MTEGRGDIHAGLLVAGWVMLFVFPIGTVVTGFVIAEHRLINGLLMCFLGTLASMVWVWFVVSVAAGLAY